MSNFNDRGSSRLPAVPGAGDESALAEIARQLVERARGEGVALTGEGGLLPALVANILQAGLNVELDDHLGYERTRSRAAGRATRATAATRNR